MSIRPIMRCAGKRVNRRSSEYRGIGIRMQSGSADVSKGACWGTVLAEEPECKRTPAVVGFDQAIGPPHGTAEAYFPARMRSSDPAM